MSKNLKVLAVLLTLAVSASAVAVALACPVDPVTGKVARGYVTKDVVARTVDLDCDPLTGWCDAYFDRSERWVYHDCYGNVTNVQCMKFQDRSQSGYNLKLADLCRGYCTGTPCY